MSEKDYTSTFETQSILSPRFGVNLALTTWLMWGSAAHAMNESPSLVTYFAKSACISLELIWLVPYSALIANESV